MPESIDLTGQLGQKKRQEWRGLDMAGFMDPSRRLRVDWFYRGMWILLGLSIASQLVLMAILV